MYCTLWEKLRINNWSNSSTTYCICRGIAGAGSWIDRRLRGQTWVFAWLKCWPVWCWRMLGWLRMNECNKNSRLLGKMINLIQNIVKEHAADNHLQAWLCCRPVRYWWALAWNERWRPWHWRSLTWMMRRSSCWLRGGAARRSHGRVICWGSRWQVLNVWGKKWYKKYQLSIGISFIQRVHKLFASGMFLLLAGW